MAGVAGRRARRVLVLAAVVVGVVAAVVLVRPFVGRPPASTGEVPGPSVAGPSTDPTESACATALAEGLLVAEDDALVLQGTTGNRTAITWPAGYGLQGDGDALVLVDPDGAIRAHQGDFVRVGGGFGNNDVFHGCGEVKVVALTSIERPSPRSFIDGFKIGVAVTCSPPIGPIDSSLAGSSCSGQRDLAIAALTARYPDHAAVVSVASYTDGTQPEPLDVTGNAPTPTPPPTAHPGPLVTVFVFTLADGSVRATGVACPDPRSCVGVGAYPN